MPPSPSFSSSPLLAIPHPCQIILKLACDFIISPVTHVNYE